MPFNSVFRFKFGPAGQTLIPPPTAVTSLTTTNGNGFIDLSFSDNSVQIVPNQYTVVVNGSTNINIGTARTYRYSNASKNTSFNFQIRSTNLVGSTTSNTVSGTILGVPDAPTNLIASPGVKQISLSWTAPANAGTPQGITSYKIEVIGVGWLYPGTATNYVWTGLATGASYSFRVYATNSVGDSAASNTVSATVSTYRNAFFSSTTFVPAHTGTYQIFVVGGGAGGGTSYGPGGGSGYYNAGNYNLTAGTGYSVVVGNGGGAVAAGGSSSFGGFISAAGGNPSSGGTFGQGTGGSGGSGGGGNSNASNGLGGGRGGQAGSNGQTRTFGFGGAGQLGVAFGSGNNANIPPGGSGRWSTNFEGAGNAISPYFWPGIYGFGAGNDAWQIDTAPQCRGGGGAGGRWATAGQSGLGGMVVYNLL